MKKGRIRFSDPKPKPLTRFSICKPSPFETLRTRERGKEGEKEMSPMTGEDDAARLQRAVPIIPAPLIDLRVGGRLS